MTETNEKVEPKPIDLGEYKYGFHDDVTPVFQQEKESVKMWSVPCLLKKGSLSGCLNSLEIIGNL